MKKTNQQIIDELNQCLKKNNQTTCIISYSSNSIALSNGTILNDKEKSRFVERVKNIRTNLWVKNIDNLLSGKITEKEIRSELASIGGKSVQKKYGNIIKQNLNTGKSWNAGTKGQRIGTLGPRDQKVKDKISEKNSGTRNGMYGTKMSEVDKKLRSNLMKKKILSGEFTPNSNNRNTHWDSTFNGAKYRSSWEALYQCINPIANYEKLRIEYTFGGDAKIYIVDFVDHINKQVIEVKPTELCTGEKFQAKMLALSKWATTHNYTIIMVDKQWLQSQPVEIDYTKFDGHTAKKIKTLYEINKKNRSK
jgi:hypothetical protein